MIRKIIFAGVVLTVANCLHAAEPTQAQIDEYVAAVAKLKQAWIIEDQNKIRATNDKAAKAKLSKELADLKSNKLIPKTLIAWPPKPGEIGSLRGGKISAILGSNRIAIYSPSFNLGEGVMSGTQEFIVDGIESAGLITGAEQFPDGLFYMDGTSSEAGGVQPVFKRADKDKIEDAFKKLKK